MTAEQIAQAVLASGLRPLSSEQAAQFEIYLALLLSWNAKLNLTSVRSGQEILARHFIECIQCAVSIPAAVRTLLDYGSGGGFPGVPCSIMLPEVHCTLAESQQKKAVFLREVVRRLDLNVSVHAGRVESLPQRTRFDAVTLRAVDKMKEASLNALTRVRPGGWIVVMTTASSVSGGAHKLPGVLWREGEALSGAKQRIFLLGQKTDTRSD